MPCFLPRRHSGQWGIHLHASGSRYSGFVRVDLWHPASELVYLSGKRFRFQSLHWIAGSLRDSLQCYFYKRRAVSVPLCKPSDTFAYHERHDLSGNALAVIDDFGQGRQYLTLTFDSNQYLVHNLVLSYGLINWVTQGIFIGEKHIYFTPQEDDWGIDDHQWLATTACGTPSDANSLPVFRLAGTDADSFVAWQNAVQTNPLFSQFKLYNAFNGFGFTANAYNPDTLTPWTADPSNSAHFGWINHTFDHTNMDNNVYAIDASEISQNIVAAQSMAFVDFNSANMVTPDISGLNDSNFLQAAVDSGVKYLVSDTSRTGPNNGPGPGFNLPIINSIQPSITEIPRRA